jgi:hypothetical protein
VGLWNFWNKKSSYFLKKKFLEKIFNFWGAGEFEWRCLGGVLVVLRITAFRLIYALVFQI